MLFRLLLNFIVNLIKLYYCISWRWRTEYDYYTLFTRYSTELASFIVHHLDKFWKNKETFTMKLFIITYIWSQTSLRKDARANLQCHFILGLRYFRPSCFPIFTRIWTQSVSCFIIQTKHWQNLYNLYLLFMHLFVF